MVKTQQHSEPFSFSPSWISDIFPVCKEQGFLTFVAVRSAVPLMSDRSLLCVILPFRVVIFSEASELFLLFSRELGNKQANKKNDEP